VRMTHMVDEYTQRIPSQAFRKAERGRFGRFSCIKILADYTKAVGNTSKAQGRIPFDGGKNSGPPTLRNERMAPFYSGPHLAKQCPARKVHQLRMRFIAGEFPFVGGRNEGGRIFREDDFPREVV